LIVSIPAVIIAHIISLVIVVPVFRPLESRHSFDDDHNGNARAKDRYLAPRLHNYLRLR
jgi:hypothetical protein